MRRLALSRLLQLVVLMPLVATVAFGGVLGLETLSTYREVERLSGLEQLVVAASRLTIKALNAESDASQAYVASGSEVSAPRCLRRASARTTLFGRSRGRLGRPAWPIPRRSR